MITRSEAEAIVLERLNATADASHRAAILDAWIRPYGWVVFYDSEKYVRTGNDFDRFFGNAPFVIMHDGGVHTLGTARAAEAELAAFEHANGLASG